MRFVLIAALMVAGCSGYQPGTLKPGQVPTYGNQGRLEVPHFDSAAEAYAGVSTPVEFWIRENDLASLKNSQNLVRKSDSYKRCVAEGIVAHSSPQSLALVEQFIAEKSDENYDRVADDNSNMVFDGKSVSIDVGMEKIVDECD